MKRFIISVLSVGLVVFSATKLAITNSTNPNTTSVSVTQTENVPIVNNIHTEAPFETTKKIENLKLDQNQVLTLFGEVNEQTVDLANKITAMGDSKKPIYLLINSPGGSVLDGARVVAAIQGSKVPVYTVCLQLCASMAFIIHQYGTERYMTDRSMLMSHQAAAGLQGSLGQMNTRLAVLTRFTEKMSDFIAKRAGLTLDVYENKIVNEMWLDAEDATSMRFNDKIVTVNVDKGILNMMGTSKTSTLLRAE